MHADREFRPDGRLRRKYHWTVWLVFLIGFAPLTALGLIPDLGSTFVVWYLAGNALWLAGAHLLIPPYVASISYQFGDQELVERKGIITRVENVVPYRMVTNVRAKRGPLDRALGLGTLEIHTAGYSQQTNAEAKLEGLVDYSGVRLELRGRLSEANRSLPGAETASATDDEPTIVRLLTEIRDELLARRSS